MHGWARRRRTPLDAMTTPERLALEACKRLQRAMRRPRRADVPLFRDALPGTRQPGAAHRGRRGDGGLARGCRAPCKTHYRHPANPPCPTAWPAARRPSSVPATASGRMGDAIGDERLTETRAWPQ